MGLMLMTGVSGPLLDTFFLGGDFQRREIIATKATCQVASHFTKLIYFGGIIDQAATLDPVLALVAVRSAIPPLGQPPDHDRGELLFAL
jgi:hypothetical protein